MDRFGFDQADLVSGSGLVKVYTCPERTGVDVDSVTGVRASVQDRDTQTQVTSIVICNYGAVDRWYSLSLTTASSDTPASKNRLIYQDTVAAGTTRILSLGLVLSAGNTLWAEAEATSALAMTINRIEV